MHRFVVKVLSLITVMLLLLDLTASSKTSSRVSSDVTIPKTDTSDLAASSNESPQLQVSSNDTIPKTDSSCNYGVKLDNAEILFLIVLWCVGRAGFWLFLHVFLSPDSFSWIIGGYRNVKHCVHHLFLHAFLVLDFAYEHRNRLLRRRLAILQIMRPDIIERLREHTLRNPIQRTLTWEDSPV